MHQIEESPVDLLSDEFEFERATSGKRLANYIIDLVVFYILIFVVAFGIAAASPETLASLDDDSTSFNLLDRIITLFFYGLYMSLVEGLLKGKSIGKFITKTRAVNSDGTPITFGTAFGRGFSRAVPFCAFSAFGDPCNPWQDRWTNTMVVNDKPVVKY
ncbi:RDD family protein [Pseudoflavitalea sp. G-6-1-2]|uniref:RDD family protein n=1 Tax=Pseudoflavitalea sp. G-6-1-2 TaxID=2728841 RepID=UPI00146E5BD6|nr:RDD family protein [Pseudoflavitalea sp. G-6-1-2]NML21382.1 RDD family protein [Pseudoflavitalea sp. G-6-1-2]